MNRLYPTSETEEILILFDCRFLGHATGYTGSAAPGGPAPPSRTWGARVPC